MAEPEIIQEDRGGVRVLFLNRPPANSLSLSLLDALGAEISVAESDSAVRAVVLCSKIAKYFSAGLDLEELFSLPEARRAELFRKLVEIHRRLASVSKPTVAAIEGAALLGGFILSLGCDWRYLSEESGKVSLSEVRLGLSPTPPLIRLVLGLTGKPGLVKDLVLQGRILRASEAFEAGLVDKLLPSRGFMEESLREAERLSRLAPTAYASIKRSLRSALLDGEDLLWEEGGREFSRLFVGPEAREGLLALKEKRKPRWE